MCCLQPNLNLSRWLNPKTLTWIKGQTIFDSHLFFKILKIGFSHPILTQVRTGSLVFSKGITHGDILRGSY